MSESEYQEPVRFYYVGTQDTQDVYTYQPHVMTLGRTYGRPVPFGSAGTLSEARQAAETREGGTLSWTQAVTPDGVVAFKANSAELVPAKRNLPARIYVLYRREAVA